ncbi:uncharacterized protein [Labrus bergylta]|uniref:uncharacterized protein n=1 Tax=Labrus bergylta TaxID=56723 RepID=UPI00331391F4
MDEEEEEESVLRVKRRSRRFSQRTIVPEDLRPALTEQVQLQAKRRVSQRLDTPARAEPPAVSHRPEKVAPPTKEEERPSKPSKDSARKPVVLLDTALLEEPEPSTEPLRPAVRSRSVHEEQNPLAAAKPSRPSSPSPLVHIPRMDPLTFSPMCNISPIKKRESYWSQSDQFGSRPSRGEERAPPADVLLHKQKQQKISSFLSSCGDVRTLGSVSTPSRDVSVRQVDS